MKNMNKFNKEVRIASKELGSSYKRTKEAMQIILDSGVMEWDGEIFSVPTDEELEEINKRLKGEVK